MNATKITSGPFDVISTGSIIACFFQPIEIRVELEDYTFTLIFRFEDEQGTNLQPMITADVVEPMKLELTLKNFSSSLGSGNIKPMAIGKSLNKTLLLSYRVYDLGNTEQKSDKLLHYTLYRDQREEN